MSLFWQQQKKLFSSSRTGVWYHPMIIRFCLSLAAKSASCYEELRARTKLKNFKVSQIFPEASAATCVTSERIFINENQTQFRKHTVTKANKKRKDGLLLSVWTIDGNIFVKTSPEGTPIRIF